MSTHLKSKKSIREFSYKPHEVKKLEESGGIIIDIVTTGRGSLELKSWSDWFRLRRIPCFACRVGHGSQNVKLWIDRTVDSSGRVIEPY